jgi:Sensors of blue-light using FAD
MHRLTYSSRRIDDTDASGFSPDFADIGAVASRNNEQLHVTGFLICTPHWFCQILEGEWQNLEKLMDAIEKDQRHFNVTLIESTPCSTRLFAHWAMGWRHQTINNRILFLEQELVQNNPPVLIQVPSVHRLALALAEDAVDEGARSQTSTSDMRR